MLSLPPLIEEDIQCMDSALDELLQKSEATATLLIDKGGPLITQRGALEGFDATTLAALAAGSFAANEAIAGLVGESNFSSIYQQGEHHSLLVGNVGENLLLIVIFKTGTSVGVVKFYMATTVQEVSCQLQKARARTPGETVDLVGLDLPDTSQLFKRKAQ
jgi:predicted regulator of Ras-like GTPase activity (Roadblock/LC7/MglB family)